MSLLSGFNVTIERANVLGQAALAAFRGGAIPSGYTVVTPAQLGIAPQFWDGNYFTNNGASAVVLRQGNDWIVSFRGTDGQDDINQFPQLANGTYINNFSQLLSAVAANAPAGTSFSFTGASLGGGATNQMADIASSQFGGRFAAASFVGFASPYITNANGILNIGSENDPVFKLISNYVDAASSMDNIVLASAPYMSGNFDGRHPFDPYAHSAGETLDGIGRLSVSVFRDVMTPDSVIILDANIGLVQDITPGRENATVFYIGENRNDVIAGRSGADYIEGFAGDDLLTGGGGNDTIDGGIGTDTAVFSGAFSQYAITLLSNGWTQVTDLRAGSPDGVDTVHDIELLQFTDRTVAVTVPPSDPGPDVNTGFRSAALGTAGFGLDTGWVSQDTYPRDVADINGDGLADIVGFGNAGVFVSLATGGGHFAAPSLVLGQFGASQAAGGWTGDNVFHRELGDVNGDGMADIIGFANAGVYVSLATGNGNFAAANLAISAFGALPSAGGWASEDQYLRLVADVNGDHRADVIGFGNAGVSVSLGTANGSFTSPVLSLAQFGASQAGGGWVSDNLYHRELGDVNGDGMADIIGFGNAGVYVSLATGNGNFANPISALAAFGATPEQGWTSQEQFPREVADVNGDGRADIVGFGISGVYYALGNANGTFGSPVPDLHQFGYATSAGGWTSDDTFPRLLGDVTGDGNADIIGFSNSGAYTSVSTLAHDFLLT